MNTVRQAKTPKSREEVYHLRYEVHAADMPWPDKYLDHRRRMIRDPLDDDAILLISYCGDLPVGTLRLVMACAGPVEEYLRLYGLDSLGPDGLTRLALCSRFCVKRTHRDGVAARRLIAAALAIGIDLQIEHAYAECDANHLPMYQRIGFKVINDRLDNPSHGLSILIRLDMARYRKHCFRSIEKLS